MCLMCDLTVRIQAVRDPTREAGWHRPETSDATTSTRPPAARRSCRSKGKAQVEYKWFCTEEEVEVPWNDIVKGFEDEKGQFVVLTDEDFAKAKTERARRIWRSGISCRSNRSTVRTSSHRTGSSRRRRVEKPTCCRARRGKNQDASASARS